MSPSASPTISRSFDAARTDSLAANLLTSDVDERDQPYCTGERSPEGFYYVKTGIESCIARAKSYAPIADLTPAASSEEYVGIELDTFGAAGPQRLVELILDGAPVVSVDAGELVSVEREAAQRLLSSGATLGLRCG